MIARVMETKTLTIMFTDIKGFTAKTSDSSRDEMKKMMTEHERLLLPTFQYFGGRVVKTIGDAYLVVFESPTDAVLCGMAVQEVLRQRNSAVTPEDRIDVRVALNLGEVELKDGDVMGEPVNIAARLEGIAEAGEVYFTEAVCLSMNRTEIPSTEVGDRTFKGIPYSVRVYRVAADANSDQVRKLRQGVRVTKDSVELEGLRPRGARVFSRVAAIAAGGGAVAALAAVGLWLLAVNSPQRRALRQADAMAAKGELTSALFMVDQALKRDPLDPDLREKAVALSARHVIGLADEKPEEAESWLSDQLRDRPYLEPLKSMMPSLEARALAQAMVRSEVRESVGWDQVRQLVWKNPKDPEVPYQMARILEKKFIPEALIWLYQKSFDLGAHRDDAHAFELCEKIFNRDVPDETRGAHEFSKQYFPERRAAWASKAVDEGNGYAMLNAWMILKEKDDPRLKDPKVKARAAAEIRKLIADKDTWGSTKEKLRSSLKKLST